MNIQNTKSLPTSALLYAPLAMLFAALHIVTTLTFLKANNWHNACVIPSLFAVIVLLGIYRLFGSKQSLLTVILSAACLSLFLLACKLAVAFPPALQWHQQSAYAAILNFSWWQIVAFVGVHVIVEIFMVAVLSLTFSKYRQPVITFFYPYISMFFVVILMTCNITTQKIATLFHITVDIGTWFFPLVFIFNNIFTEVYGYAASRIIIWSGLLINSVLAFMLALAVMLPSNHWPLQSAFALIAGMTFRIVFASMISYFCSEFTNSYILAKLKILLKGRLLWVRTISSTAIAMIVDSVLFTSLAFVGVIPFSTLVQVAAFQYLLKVSFEIIFTPITYKVVCYLKQREGIDYFDFKTNFNPFNVLINNDY